MFEDELDNIEENNNEETKAENAEVAETEAAAEEKSSKKDSKKKASKKEEEEVFISEDNGLEIGAKTDAPAKDSTVTVQPVKFASFDQLEQVAGEENKNLDILMDVKLQLNVELGRCELPIKKVLELTRGSIIELDKVAGEPVELFANGKLIAHGEVVVIDDNFGLRITSITEPDNRIN